MKRKEEEEEEEEHDHEHDDLSVVIQEVDRHGGC